MSKETLGKEGCYNGDDSWLHNLQEDDDVVSKVNRQYRTLKKSELFVDLSKGVQRGGRLNTSKLVKKRVMVRRADGTTFYREQWVKPYESPGMDSSSGAEVEENSNRVLPVEPPSSSDQLSDLDMFPELQASKKKSYDLSTQKGFLDEKLDSMSKEEKQKLITRYGITWNEHANEQRNWMLAVMALKDHMYKNPHLLGAEHLSKDGTGDPIISGIDRETQWCNDTGREKCYDLMKEWGIGDGVDPKVADPNDKGAPIKHMRNMMALKEYLKQNPHLMDDKPIAKTSSVPSPAEKGGNDIHEIFKKMSNEEKYKLAIELGICTGDPKKDPDSYNDTDKNGDKLHPSIKHMRIMMELKKRIELEPSILIKDGDGVIRDGEQKRLDGMNDEQKKKEEIKDLCSKLSKENKQKLLHIYSTRDEIADRKTNDSQHIDWMLAVGALKELMSNADDVLDLAREFYEEQRLEDYKFGNKDLEKILRGMASFTSKTIDYVKSVDPHREWEFGLGSSIMKQMNDDGQWVLSILDTGYDGSEWNEQEILVKDAIKFLEDWQGRKIDPLYQKSTQEIFHALHHNPKLYTKNMEGKLKNEFLKAWKMDKTDNLGDLIVEIDGISMKVACDLLERWGVPLDKMGDDMATIDVGNDVWKSIIYADMIHKTKQMEAHKYVPIDMDGNPDIYPLLESAKLWTSEEKYEARSEMVKGNLTLEFKKDAPNSRKKDTAFTINKYITECLEVAPFEVFADMMLGSYNSLKISITQDVERSSFNKGTNTISLNCRYVNNFYSYTHHNPLQFHGGGHPFADTIIHEWAHALDSFLGNGRYSCDGAWSGDRAQKYVPEKHRDCTMKSFNSKVNSSNPNKQLIKVEVGGGSFEYYYKDEWMSNYEGRAYLVDEKRLKVDEKGNLYDGLPQGKYTGYNVGVEHFSENVSRYGTAMIAYKYWRQSYLDEHGDSATPPSFDKWAGDMEKWYVDHGLGDDFTESVHGTDRESYRNGTYEYSNGTSVRDNTFINRDSYTDQTYGYLYSTLKKRNPDMWSFINNVLNRPDFHKTNSVDEKPTERISEGQPVRKGLYINIWEGCYESSYL